MKILVLSNLYPPHYVGGYELYCQAVVEWLRERGHSVQVLTSDHRAEKVSSPLDEKEVARSLKLHGLIGHPFVGILQLKRLEFLNNRILISTLQRVNPDLVYVWNFGGLSKSMLFTLQKLRIPTVFSVCDHWIARSQEGDVWLNWWNRPHARLRHRFLRTLWTRWGYRGRCQRTAPTNPIHHLRFERIHFCSRALREFTNAAGFEVQHGAVIHLPVDIAKFHGSPRIAQNPMQRLLYVGRLHEDKGVMTVFRALTLIRNKFAGQLHLYGEGDPGYEEKLRSFANEERLPVTFHGALDSRVMPDVYRAHDALLFPSEWLEPFALTPLEAMASGLPVIGTTTGGSAELFRHGENCLTYSAGNASELAQRILELDSDGSLRERIAKTGQEEIRSRFNNSHILRQVEAYLLETPTKWKPSPLPAYDV